MVLDVTSAPEMPGLLLLCGQKRSFDVCIWAERHFLRTEVLGWPCLLCLSLNVCEGLEREKNLSKQSGETYTFLSLSLSLSIMTNLIKTNLDPGRKIVWTETRPCGSLTVPRVHHLP